MKKINLKSISNRLSNLEMKNISGSGEGVGCPYEKAGTEFTCYSTDSSVNGKPCIEDHHCFPGFCKRCDQ